MDAGQRFGRLVVIKESVETGKFVCACDCGGQVTVVKGHLKSGNTKSCGCFRRGRASRDSRKKPPKWYTESMRK